MKNNPWDRLAIGDAKRFSSNGRFDFFWIMLEDSTPGMMLKLNLNQLPQEPVPKLRSVDVKYRLVGDRQSFVLALRDKSLSELFETLCRSVADAGEQGRDEDDALSRSLLQTKRWHHLLRGGSTGALSNEEQKGLVAELAFLRVIANLRGPEVAIAAWRGPEDSPKDFELPDLCVEVKARRVAARAYVSISSAEQLADVDGIPVFLRVSDIVTSVKPTGMTLHEHVEQTSRELQSSPIAISRFDELLAEAGYDRDQNYDSYTWSVGNSRDFRVQSGFPRIVPPLPAGVERVTYAIGLDDCAPFETASPLPDIMSENDR